MSDIRETRRPGVFCMSFDMTDFNTSVRVTKFMQNEEKASMRKTVSEGVHVGEGGVGVELHPLEGGGVLPVLMGIGGDVLGVQDDVATASPSMAAWSGPFPTNT